MMSDSSHGRGRTASGWVPDAVAQVYYRYGLLVATHPFKVILFAAATFLFLSSPLYYLPLPGHLPQEYLTPEHNYSVPSPAEAGIMLSPSPTPTPLWYQGAPLAYILQVVVRSSIGPVSEGILHPELSISDSYRGPLATMFDLHRTLSDYQFKKERVGGTFGENKKDRQQSQAATSKSTLDESGDLNVKKYKIESDANVHKESNSTTIFNAGFDVNHTPVSSGLFLGNQCLLVEDVVKQHREEGRAGGFLPHFSCLLLSPADLWTRDRSEFLRDPHVLTTVKSLMASYKGQSKVADILFGVPSAEVGLLQNTGHPRVITYAFTLALKTYNEEFVNGLRGELSRRYPLHQDSQPHSHQITHLYFPYRLSLWEVLIFIFFCCLFISVYFSLRKMEILSNKIGISITVLVTLVSSLCLAVGTCAYWGLKPLHSQGKYVYPVLAGLVGFENSMVLIRCIASTPQHLDVKIRVAQGLAQEGWTITKYFLSMITLVTLSFFLFIPIVQEICIYGSLVLLCDLYMQLVFLTAVLCIDLQRCHDSKKHLKRDVLLSSGWTSSSCYGSGHRPGYIKTISFDVNSVTTTGIPNLHRRKAVAKSSIGEDIVAPPSSEPTKATSVMPKRLRITYFVTSKRMFQRMFMCIFVGWIAWIVYNTTGLFDNWERISDPGPGLASVISSIKSKSSEQFEGSEAKSVYHQMTSNADDVALPDGAGIKNADAIVSHVETAVLSKVPSKLHSSKLPIKRTFHDFPKSPLSPSQTAGLTSSGSNSTIQNGDDYSDAFEHLQHSHPHLTDYLPETHWPTLFGYYNLTLRGQYISLLPPVLLSVPVSVEGALAVHQPADPNDGPWLPPRVNLDPDLGGDTEGWWVSLMTGSSSFNTSSPDHRHHHHSPAPSPPRGGRYRGGGRHSSTPFVPSSSGEMIVTAILAIPAVLVLVYATVWLYRCVCSRNYAEWREQWWGGEQAEARAQIIGECVPVPLVGHQGEVECVCTDGVVVASACLAGTIRVWDPVTTECIVAIDRARGARQGASPRHEDCSSDYASGSPRSQPELHSKFCSACIWQHPSEDFSNCYHELPALAPAASATTTPRPSFNLPNLTPTIRTDFTAMYSARGSEATPCSRNHAGNSSSHNWMPFLGTAQQQRRKRFKEWNVSCFDGFNVGCGSGGIGLKRNYSTESLVSRKSSLDSLWKKGTKSSYSLLQSSQQLMHRQMLSQYERNVAFKNIPRDHQQHPKETQHHLKSHRRNLSAGNTPLFVSEGDANAKWPSASNNPPAALPSADGSCPRRHNSSNGLALDGEYVSPAAVWSLQCQDGLVFAGCADGRIEVYDAYSGKLKFVSGDSPGVGVTAMSVSGTRLVAARLSGAVDLYAVHVTDTTTINGGDTSAAAAAGGDVRSTPSCVGGVGCAGGARQDTSACAGNDSYSTSPWLVPGASDGGGTDGGAYRRAAAAAAPSSTPRDNKSHRRGDSCGTTQYTCPVTTTTTTSSGCFSPNTNTCYSSTQQQYYQPQHQLQLLLQQQPHKPPQHQLHHLQQQQEKQQPVTISFGDNNEGIGSMRNATSAATASTPTAARIPTVASDNRRIYDTTHLCMHDTAPTQYCDGSTSSGSPPGDGVSDSTAHCWREGVGDDGDGANDEEGYEARLVRDVSTKAHHQPISVLCCDAGLAVTGSLDHTLKVLNLHDGSCNFTLHGHLGPVTTATLGGPTGSVSSRGDAVLHMGWAENLPSPHHPACPPSLEGAIIASGAQDGSLCVWDVATGACVYSVCGHQGAVLSIATSSSYLISLGADERLAVWERFRGHLLNTLHLADTFCSAMVMLTHKLLITTRQGRLCVWDVSTGGQILEVPLDGGGGGGQYVFPRHLLRVGASVLCDYGSTLRAVRMPVAEKME